MGFGASLAAGMGTALGAIGVLLFKRPTARMSDGLLSAAAGVMLAATFFSLLQPAIEYGEAQYDSRLIAVGLVVAGVIGGALGLFLIHRFVPHEHFIIGRQGPDNKAMERIWLFVLAITLHNFPEGMAVGVGFAGGDLGKGLSLAIGIGLQNIPEGLAVAAALSAIGYARSQAFWVACLTGLVEPVGGAFGASATWLAAAAMPWILGMAAGAMLFVISDEIIPETHRGGHQELATFSLLGGFCVMMVLDTVFG
ncbi:protein gufA [Steroidobacter denitrificans]|uniref:Protein gufA n=2 Tax=Steroidobacter denitrificans TaxID=465721 RepID=A0A127FBF3_STEDE|nr:protein gufA [Steroidobacter denitrificans]